MVVVRDFSWDYFAATGEIDAYLLLKEYENACCNADKTVKTMESAVENTEIE